MGWRRAPEIISGPVCDLTGGSQAGRQVAPQYLMAGLLVFLGLSTFGFLLFFFFPPRTICSAFIYFLAILKN